MSPDLCQPYAGHREEDEAPAPPSGGTGLRKTVVSTHSHSKSELEKFALYQTGRETEAQGEDRAGPGQNDQ